MTTPYRGASVLLMAAIVLGFCGSRPQSWGQEKQSEEKEGPAHLGDVQIQMKNVNFRFARDIAFEVRTLRGQLRRTKTDVPVTFDDSESFTVEVDSVCAGREGPVRRAETFKDKRLVGAVSDHSIRLAGQEVAWIALVRDAW